MLKGFMTQRNNFGGIRLEKLDVVLDTTNIIISQVEY